MQEVTLYQLDTNGKTKQWSIRVDENPGKTANIVVRHGQQGGKIQEKTTLIYEGKNIGRSNETSCYEQAVLEARSDIDRKKTKGYTEDINNIKPSSVKGSGSPAPMLAQKYDPTMKQGSSKDLKKLGLEGKEVAWSDKLDGNRALALVTLHGATLYSRTGKLHQRFENIEEQLVECFNKIYQYVNSKYGVTEYWIDGELFTQKYSFNTVNGATKTLPGKRTPEHIAILNDVHYHIYDVILPVGYETRYKVIQYFKHDNLDIVSCQFGKADAAVLADSIEDAMARGQEGLIIRQLGIPYETKRSWQLLKYKAFEDDEFEVVGFKEQRGGGTLGSIEFKFKRKDGQWGTFFATPCATDEEVQTFWNEKEKHLGEMLTVEYFGFSEIAEGGKPRFPKCKKLVPRDGND